MNDNGPAMTGVSLAVPRPTWCLSGRLRSAALTSSSLIPYPAQSTQASRVSS